MRWVSFWLAVAMALAGCTNQSPTTCVLTGLDGSGSTNGVRQRYLGLLDKLVADELPINSHLIIWRFDTQAVKIYSGCPQNARELAPLRPYLQPTPEKGTWPDKVLAQMGEELPRIEEQQVALILFWDGEDFNPSETTQQIHSLAEDSRLQAVWIVGVAPQFRHRVEQACEPLRGRCVVSGLADVQSGLDEFSEKLREE